MDLFQFDIIDPQQQPIVFRISTDAKFFGLLLLAAATHLEAVPPSHVRILVLLFLLAPRHHEFYGTGDIFGLQAPQADDFKPPVTAVQFLQQFRDNEMVRQRTTHNDRLVFFINLDLRQWIEITELTQDFDERFGINCSEAIDLRVVQRLQQIAPFRRIDVQGFHRLADDGHFVGRCLGQNTVPAGIHDQEDLLLAATGSGAGTAATTLGHLLDLLHHLLLHLNHLLIHLPISATTTPSTAAGFLHPQQITQHAVHINRANMFQLKFFHQLFLSIT